MIDIQSCKYIPKEGSVLILVTIHSSLLYILCSFEEQEVPGSRSFFTEIIASIADLKFARDGRYMLSRDYMSLKVFVNSGIVHCIFVNVAFYI